MASNAESMAMSSDVHGLLPLLSYNTFDLLTKKAKRCSGFMYVIALKIIKLIYETFIIKLRLFW